MTPFIEDDYRARRDTISYSEDHFNILQFNFIQPTYLIYFF